MQIVAALEDGLGNDTETHQNGEDLASDAERQDRLQGCRDEHQTNQDEGGVG